MPNATLQDKVNQYMIREVKAELKDVMAENNFTPEKTDGTPVESMENLHKVMIPKTMNKLQASHNLLKQFEEEETLRKYNRNYDFFFMNDFMVAMNAMIKKYFGMIHVSKRDTDGDPAPNDYIQVPIRYSEAGELVTEQGYIGSVKAPCWEDAIVDIHPQGYIAVKAKLKYEAEVNRFLQEVNDYIVANSVVKGSSVTIQQVRGGMLANPINPKKNNMIILDEEVERIVSNLIIPSLADKSKTSLLLTGDFGTGKTETAIRIGVSGQRLFGRTFFYLHNAEHFNALIPYLKNYQPSIVFVEDVDQISGGDRDSSMNDLLNQLDGNELKNVNCTFIFTTNNHKKIHPAMRRPGRIDQVIHFDYCTPAMIAKIFEMHVIGMEGADTVDYLAAAQKAPENLQGAVVAEISRRAKKYATGLHNGVISTDIFLDAIASMKHHIQFMREDQEKDVSVEAQLGSVLFKTIGRAFPEFKDNFGDDSEYKLD
jgi:transitional endoplasmic reticulum ATPase